MVPIWDRRSCDCGIWEENPGFDPSQGIPPGYCDVCMVCDKPDHTMHFPGRGLILRPD
jgi:hypothetical protein